VAERLLKNKSKVKNKEKIDSHERRMMGRQLEMQQYINSYESICEEEDETSRSHFDTISGQYNKKPHNNQQMEE
jgi:hypothetical protein